MLHNRRLLQARPTIPHRIELASSPQPRWTHPDTLDRAEMGNPRAREFHPSAFREEWSLENRRSVQGASDESGDTATSRGSSTTSGARGQARSNSLINSVRSAGDAMEDLSQPRRRHSSSFSLSSFTERVRNSFSDGTDAIRLTFELDPSHEGWVEVEEADGNGVKRVIKRVRFVETASLGEEGAIRGRGWKNGLTPWRKSSNVPRNETPGPLKSILRPVRLDLRRQHRSPASSRRSSQSLPPIPPRLSLPTPPPSSLQLDLERPFKMNYDSTAAIALTRISTEEAAGSPTTPIATTRPIVSRSSPKQPQNSTDGPSSGPDLPESPAQLQADRSSFSFPFAPSTRLAAPPVASPSTLYNMSSIATLHSTYSFPQGIIFPSPRLPSLPRNAASAGFCRRTSSSLSYYPPSELSSLNPTPLTSPQPRLTNPLDDQLPSASASRAASPSIATESKERQSIASIDSLAALGNLRSDSRVLAFVEGSETARSIGRSDVVRRGRSEEDRKLLASLFEGVVESDVDEEEEDDTDGMTSATGTASTSSHSHYGSAFDDGFSPAHRREEMYPTPPETPTRPTLVGRASSQTKPTPPKRRGPIPRPPSRLGTPLGSEKDEV